MSGSSFSNEYINKGTMLVPFNDESNPLSEEDISQLQTAVKVWIRNLLPQVMPEKFCSCWKIYDRCTKTRNCKK